MSRQQQKPNKCTMHSCMEHEIRYTIKETKIITHSKGANFPVHLPACAYGQQQHPSLVGWQPTWSAKKDKAIHTCSNYTGTVHET